MKILAIDTSNQTLALGLSENGRLIGQMQTTVNKNHSLTLMPAIDQLMKSVHWQPSDLEKIVVAQGPGSYTGLRIGVTTAKTLAQTLGIELVGISSLAIVAANMVHAESWIVPLFDARRKNVYAGAYVWQDNQLINVLSDQHIAFADLAAQLPANVLFVGESVANFQDEIHELCPQAQINQVEVLNYPNGFTLAQLAQNIPSVVDVHRFLPHYLKKVEAEEKWLADNQETGEAYVEKI
ncbi:MAG: tRNA (adenosine(37)-N6)-threonylcarbamoyltransferase complex dimerization subunit type 1 TsaB [Enterococcus sp.]